MEKRSDRKRKSQAGLGRRWHLSDALKDGQISRGGEEWGKMTDTQHGQRLWEEMTGTFWMELEKGGSLGAGSKSSLEVQGWGEAPQLGQKKPWELLVKEQNLFWHPWAPHHLGALPSPPPHFTTAGLTRKYQRCSFRPGVLPCEGVKVRRQLERPAAAHWAEWGEVCTESPRPRVWCCGPESNGAKERPVSGNDLPLSKVSVERQIKFRKEIC